MRFLAISFLFAGYVLVYASVAAGGKFATEPWAGLFADAYTSNTTSNSNTASPSSWLPPGYTPLSPTPPGYKPPVRPRASAPANQPNFTG